jgi:hypothetical protein
MSQLITREYKGTTFTFREDGYFNMTKAAAAFGKFLPHFMRSPETVEYVAALSKTADYAGLEIVQAKAGRYGGTWAHPKLAVFFARWLDVKFAVFCDMVIDDILNKKAELVITKPEESAVMKLPQSYLEALGPLVGQKQPIKGTVEYIAALSKTVKSTGLEIVQAKTERLRP